MSHDAAPESFERFGALLRHLRVRARRSQRELAEALGYSEAHLSRLEQGQRRPDLDVVRARLIPALGLEPASPWAERLRALAGAEPHPAPAPGAHPAPAPDSLLVTKLARPPVPRGAIPRPRLLARLEGALDAPLTLVAAPPGFGKTSLVAAWIAARERRDRPSPFGWLALDPGDNDPALFVRYLVAAVRVAAPEIGATTLALLAGPPRPLPGLLAPLLNDLAALDRDVVLVLDDYHVIEVPAIHEALAFLLDRAPPRLHLVIATRADPPLPLVRLRARGQLLELRARDLRFDTAETGAFLRGGMGLRLADAEVAALEARTEGWAAALQLAALALGEGDGGARMVGELAASSRYLADYLAEEVLDRLPPHLRSFVLQTSILDRLSGPLCDAVLGTPAAPGEAYSQMLLLELERRNLFLVPLDDARRWYRYHQLFAEAARARLLRGASPEQVAALYRRAAAAEPAPERGVEYLLTARLWGEAAERVAAIGRAVLANGQLRTVERWVTALPAEERAARPFLHVLHGIAVAQSGGMAEAEPLLERGLAGCQAQGDAHGQGAALTELAVLAMIKGDLTQSIRRIEGALALEAPPPARVYALTFAIGAYACLGAREPVDRLAAELFGLLRYADDATLRTSVLPGAHSLAVSLHGELAALERLCRDGLTALGGQLSLALVGVEAALAHIAWLRGRLDEAETMARRAFATSARFGAYALVEPQMLSIEAIVAAARGDLAAAAELFERALDERWMSPFYSFAVPAQLYVRARALWQLGRLAELPALAARLEALGSNQVPLKAAMRDLLAALPAIAAGRLDDAERLLAPLAAREHEVGLMAVFGSARPLLAHVAVLRGRPGEAVEALAPLLADCARDGTPGRLLLEGPYVIPLLRLAAAGAAAHAPFAARVLALFGAQGEGRASPEPARVPRPEALAEPLTERELEVLRLLAAGHSNQEIADSLVIAVGTVKRHVSNLAGKLAAPSRLAAVARARELDLI